MTEFVLYFTACIASSMSQCEDYQIPNTAKSARECSMFAQPRLAEWAVEHPNRWITRYNCGPSGVAKI